MNSKGRRHRLRHDDGIHHYPRLWSIRFVLWLWWWLGKDTGRVLMATATGVTNTTNNNDNNDDNIDDDFCALYFAPSTIPGAGWGVFTARNLSEGAVVERGELLIPVQEPGWNNGMRHEYDPPHLWTAYCWDYALFDDMSLEGEDVTVNSLGTGAMPNCHFPMVNVDYLDHKVQYNRMGITRNDPGAGAFTPFHDRPLRALKNVPAGMELFVDYGEGYFSKWDNLPDAPLVPKAEDRRAARSMLQNFWIQLMALKLMHGTWPDIQMQSKQVELAMHDLFTMIHDLSRLHHSRVLDALPKDFAQFMHVIRHGLEDRDYHRSIRSVEELQQTGFCIDHIRSGISTLPHAGRGAFAKRSLAQGSVVAPVPLIHMGDRALYDIYRGKLDPDDGDFVRDVDKGPWHTQLMMNYCFGHEQSTILLCNYGSGVSMINHSEKHANVKLQWSTVLSSHLEWLDLPPSDWTSAKQVGLAMELVATRDIARDEEIFLDYGDAWEAAWNEHVAKWKPPQEASWYRTASELNKDIDLVVRTRQEGSYGDWLAVYCSEYYRVAQGLAKTPNGITHHLCEAVDRRWTPDGYRYTVELLHQVEGKEKWGICVSSVKEVLWDVPRDAFYFRDELYSRDHLQPWSFRHHIEIPDELFPNVWKNMKEVA